MVIKYGVVFILIRWIVLVIELLVWSVFNIKWLVNVFWRLIFMVFWLCIFFIMIMLGFWCNVVWRMVVKFSLILVLIWIWLICGRWYLMGFLVVMILRLGLLSLLSVLYRVVVLLEFVGFVIRIILWGWLMVVLNFFVIVLGILVWFSVSRLVDWFNKCIIIVFLLVIGMVDICIFKVCFFILILNCLFCGICFLDIFKLDMSLSCSISVDVIFIWLSVFFCKMLLICWWICRIFLLGLMWIFDVLIWMVFLNMEWSSLMIVVFEVVLLSVDNLKLVLFVYFLFSFLVNDVMFWVWW